MSLREDISKEISVALKAGEKLRLSALRMLLSAVKYKEVDLRRDATDEEAQQVVLTLLRQRQDSVEQFKKGNRPDLAEKEEAEMEVLKKFLPAQLSPEEIKEVVKKAAAEIKASGMKDMGRLMKEVMPKLKGKAEGKLINDIVKEVLG